MAVKDIAELVIGKIVPNAQGMFNVIDQAGNQLDMLQNLFSSSQTGLNDKDGRI